MRTIQKENKDKLYLLIDYLDDLIDSKRNRVEELDKNYDLNKEPMLKDACEKYLKEMDELYDLIDLVYDIIEGAEI